MSETMLQRRKQIEEEVLSTLKNFDSTKEMVALLYLMNKVQIPRDLLSYRIEKSIKESLNQKKQGAL